MLINITAIEIPKVIHPPEYNTVSSSVNNIYKNRDPAVYCGVYEKRPIPVFVALPLSFFPYYDWGGPCCHHRR